VIDPTTAVEAARVLDHHGPEAIPFIELAVGGGLPLAAGLVMARWKQVTTRVRQVVRSRATTRRTADPD
jgi:hypothetical protein